MSSGPLPVKKFHQVHRNDPTAADFKSKQEAKLRNAAQMYEQRFLDTMVSQMRKTVNKSEFMKSSFAQRIFEQKLDNQYVESWTKQGGIGLADMIYDQLHQKMFPKNVQRPNGPIPIPKEQFHNVESAKQEESFKIIQPENQTTDNPNETSFLIRKEKGDVTTPVTAPWSGEIKNTVPSLNGQPGLVQVTHDNGLESVLSFHGPLEKSLQTGQKVESGQAIGQMTGLDQDVFWRVWKKS